jgi:hypothetical protein
MAQSDSTVPFSIVDGTAVITDGSTGSVTLTLVQSEVTYTITGRPWTEGKSRNKHQSTPVARVTGDGTVTGSLSFLVTSFYGSASVTPYEALTLTNGASSWTSTGAGDRKMVKLTLTSNASGASGATQTIAFNYCVFENVAVDPQGGDGLYLITADFVDLENNPTVT